VAKVRIAQNVHRPDADQAQHRVQQPFARQVEPGKHQADHDLAEHEGEEEQRFVDADAAHRLIEKQRDEQACRDRQQIEEQPATLFQKGHVELAVVGQQALVIGRAHPGHLAQTVPFVEADPDRLEDRKIT
jgi:hypothetical protein